MRLCLEEELSGWRKNKDGEAAHSVDISVSYRGTQVRTKI